MSVDLVEVAKFCAAVVMVAGTFAVVGIVAVFFIGALRGPKK